MSSKRGELQEPHLATYSHALIFGVCRRSDSCRRCQSSIYRSIVREDVGVPLKEAG